MRKENHVDIPPLSVLSVFAGVAGLELGHHLLGGFQTVCYVENDAYAQAVLMSRMRDGSLDEAPIWNDIKTFDAAPWADLVDVVAGGFPCQDLSTAGRGKGIQEGTRSGLWFHMARIVRAIRKRRKVGRPLYVLVENVPGLLSNDGGRAFGTVLRDLADAGFDAEWNRVSAADVGAPHLRERIWIVAYPCRVVVWDEPGRGHGTDRPAPPIFGIDGPEKPLAHAAGGGLGELWSAPGETRHPHIGGEDVAHAARDGREERALPAGRRGEGEGAADIDRRGPAMADPDGAGLGASGISQRPPLHAEPGCEDVADAERAERGAGAEGRDDKNGHDAGRKEKAGGPGEPCENGKPPHARCDRPTKSIVGGTPDGVSKRVDDPR